MGSGEFSMTQIRCRFFPLLSELPRYIGYIVGFSKKTGRMYFADRKSDPQKQAFMSSYNCKDVELTGNDLPNDIEDGGAALNVPGKSIETVVDGMWPVASSEVTANFEGIYDKGVLSAKWSPCCEAPPA